MGKVQTTANTLTEKPQWVKIGWWWFMIKPATLAQLWELGAYIEDKEQLDVEGEIQPVVEMLNRYKDLKTCTEAVLILLFRKSWKRALWRKYITANLTMATYQQILEYSAMTFHATFFLTSFTFLKGAKQTTQLTNTDEATALGDLLEE